MNYFPLWFDFKNGNQFEFSSPLQYYYQNPYIFPRTTNFYQTNTEHYTPPYNYDFAPKIMSQSKQQTDHNCQKQIFDEPYIRIQNSQQKKKTLDQHQEHENNTKKKEKAYFKQKQGRNMISNLFRQIIKCILSEKNKTAELIQKIARKQNIQVNSKQLMENLAKKAKNLKNYVRLGQIELFIKGKQNDKSKEHAKVFRVLLHQFLRQDMVPCLCNNPKVQRSNRRIHIQERRALQKLLKF